MACTDKARANQKAFICGYIAQIIVRPGAADAKHRSAPKLRDSEKPCTVAPHPLAKSASRCRSIISVCKCSAPFRGARPDKAPGRTPLHSAPHTHQKASYLLRTLRNEEGPRTVASSKSI